MPSNGKRPRLRSQLWFDNPDNPGMTALYLERYLNYGLTKQELASGKPIIGIAQTGSDLSPCNRHHLELAKRVREGIRDGGGVAFEFPMHPIQETGKRPTAALDRNLAYLSLVEVLFGYPLDGVVLTTGCDKTTPAAIMAAATVNTPAIVLSGGPMLNGWWNGERAGLCSAGEEMTFLSDRRHRRRQLADSLRRLRRSAPVDRRAVVRDAGDRHVGRRATGQPRPRAQPIEVHATTLLSGTLRMLSDPTTNQTTKNPKTTGKPPGSPRIGCPRLKRSRSGPPTATAMIPAPAVAMFEKPM